MEGKKVRRFGQVIRVKEEYLEKYKALHANPWKEINEKIKPELFMAQL